MSGYELPKNPLAGGRPVKAWTKGVPMETDALEQMIDTSMLPFIFKHVALMPDGHKGAGACIGAVIPTVDAIIPAAVGVDIGCGMIAMRTNMDRAHLAGQEDLIAKAIKKAVPTGRTDNGGDRDVGSWSGHPGEIPGAVLRTWDQMVDSYTDIILADPGLEKARTVTHLGTLGTGNHFIELAADQRDEVWIVIHSGSRGIGNKIGTHFIKKAKELCKKWFIDLPNPDLAYLPKGTPEFHFYMRALQWAQKYAWNNRKLMMSLVRDAIESVIWDSVIEIDSVHCHHNYAAFEKHYGKQVIVTRKGAVRAGKDDRGIIPGSMGERSFIVKGKGERESFESCSHGAGRVMSRTAARKAITVKEHGKATEGVFCDKSADVLDESPAAYKDIEAVMAAQEDLVEIEHTLKAFINVKGVSEPRRRKK